MNICKHCKWWRVEMLEARPADYGHCMYDPPAIFCEYDPEGGNASLLYERPQTREDDFCARFEG